MTPGRPARGGGSDDRFHAIGEFVRRRRRSAAVPGMAIGVWADGEEELAAFGVASVEHPAPVTPRTLFQIGSTTKTYTATLAVRLEHEGLLDLDAPVRGYLPGLRLADRAVTRAVTMRHLLTHSAGFDGEFFEDFGSGDDALARYVAELHRLRQAAPLGAVHNYCTAGTCLAGRVIEVVAGAPFERVMAERIFEPLGLSESFFFPADAISRPVAVGHRSEDGGPATVARPWDIGRALYPAGGIVCSIRDLLRWGRFHLGDPTVRGARVLPRAKLDRMQKPSLPSGVSAWVGLGWHLWRPDGRPRIVHHGGGTNGQCAELWLVPEHRLACGIVTNADSGRDLAAKVWERVSDRYLGPAPKSRPPARIRLGAAELAEYAGRYTNQLTTIEITVEDGGLREQESFNIAVFDPEPPPPPPPRTLAFYERDRVLVVDPAAEGTPFERTEFVRDTDGRVRWYRSFGRALLKET